MQATRVVARELSNDVVRLVTRSSSSSSSEDNDDNDDGDNGGARASAGVVCFNAPLSKHRARIESVASASHSDTLVACVDEFGNISLTRLDASASAATSFSWLPASDDGALRSYAAGQFGRRRVSTSTTI